MRRNLAEHTIIHKEQHIKQFCKFIDDDDYLIKDIDNNVIKQFINALIETDLKAVSINTIL